MTALDTYQLSNIDPIDISATLLKIEQSFGFTFGDTALKNVNTFGELCDIITSKRQGTATTTCTTQQAFYILQNAIAGTLSIDKSSITPGLSLQQLFPKPERRQKIAALNKKLGFSTKILRPKNWIIAALALILVSSFIGLFIYWQVALPALFIAYTGLKLADKWGNEFTLQTLRELAEKITREHYIQVRRNNNTVNRKEIGVLVKALFKHDLDLEESALTREATFS